jgi:hypothetical protein
MNKNIKSLLIEARLWSDGNTYHAVRIWANGKVLADIGMSYGYEDQYKYTALNWLKGYQLVDEEVKTPHHMKAYADVYFISYATLKRQLFKDQPIAEWTANVDALKAGQF